MLFAHGGGGMGGVRRKANAKRSGRNVEKGLWENREKKRKIIKNEKSG